MGRFTLGLSPHSHTAPCIILMAHLATGVCGLWLVLDCRYCGCIICRASNRGLHDWANFSTPLRPGLCLSSPEHLALFEIPRDEKSRRAFLFAGRVWIGASE